MEFTPTLNIFAEGLDDRPYRVDRIISVLFGVFYLAIGLAGLVSWWSFLRNDK